MRVLIVNDDAPGDGGGIAVHIKRLAAALEAAGEDVSFYAGEVHHRGPARILDLWDPRARAELGRRARAFRADLVHFHNVLTELSPSVLGATKTARVLTVHNFHLAGEPYGPVGAPSDLFLPRAAKAMQARFVREIARRRVHEVMAPGRPIADALVALGFGHVHVVPNFVESGPEPAAPPSASDDVLFVGRLAREKGVYELVRSFVEVAATHSSARLVICGDGEEAAGLRALADRSLPGRVAFIGALDEAGVRAAMERSRVVAMPSTTRETSGLVAIEAACAGRPLVVSDDPGLRELTDEAGCAIVVPRGNVGALAEALDTMLSDPARADAMGSAGRRTVLATRTTDRVIGKIRGIYRDAVRAARTPR